MLNEFKEVADELEGDVAELGDDPEENDETDWKAEAIKARGIAKRNATRLEKLRKLSETKVEQLATKQPETNKIGFDYAEKAFLRANDIAPTEYDFVAEVMHSTGKTLDEVLEAKYFQSELKERREAKATKDAVPTGSHRSTASTRDSVDYWLAAGKLPPADQVELRRKVVNEKFKRAEDKTKFTDNPIVR